MTQHFSTKKVESTWITEVPESWKESKNKYVFRLRKEIVGENWTSYTLLSLTKKGVIPRDLESGKGKFPESFDTYQIVRENDLVFCLYDVEETPRAIGISEMEGMITGSYDVFSVSQGIPKYFYYYYLTVDDVKGMKPLYTGMRNVVRPENFNNLKIYLPSIQEQQQIVTYLDQKTSQIDTLVSLTEKKIELLKEKRTSLINEAVTKGLDRTVKMKDSGVEWIGDIPSHWEIRPLKTITDVRPSNVDKHIYPDEIQVELCNYTDVYKNDFIDKRTPLKVGSCTETEYSRFCLKKGDVIITKDSETSDDIGIPCLITEDLTNVVCGYHLTLLRPISVVGGFLFRVFQTQYIKSYFENESNGITRVALGKSSIESTFIVYPPLPEQQQIVDYINHHTSEIDKLISIEQRRIDTLKEYRQSLISEVVTGKVKVSNS